ncbi:MAG: phage antirepressor N-terminal domain-containing protein [Floccifex porci]|uniref:phage antirepressor N-terminal domain-containing protein n=1 Tax=Floccifex porci TaxID=2606629 RepID=UPI003F036ADE
MNGLAVKDVNFNGTMLRVAQDVNNIIWVGVRWVCEGLGLTEDQMRNERKRINKDLVLSKGGSNLTLPTNGGEQEVLCLMLDFLPLWLAKIHVTPKMKNENPKLVENLVEYQLKAKDVLAEAFLGKQKEEITPTTQNTQTIQLQIPGYDNQFAELNRKIDKLYSDMGKLAQIIIERAEAVKSIPEKKISNEISVIPSDSKIWKQKIYGMIDRVLDKDIRFSDANDVMKYIYDYMRKNYGIVWEQEIRDYMEQNGCVKKPSTIDIVYNNETYRSIFESVLTDITDIVTDDSNSIKKITTDDIIRPLAEKYCDGSNAAMSTYKVVYKRMDEKNNISWKNRESRYINKYGAKTLSKKNVINSSSSLMKIFAKTVDELLKEMN